MALCAFLGDELSGLGFRLAGVACYRPPPADTVAETAALFARLRGEVQLLLITAEVAARLPADLLRQAQRAAGPLLLVIADVQHRVPAPDQVAALRRQLGMAQ